MAITQAMCNSYKADLLQGDMDSTDTYKIALYTSSASLGATTSAYTVTQEVASGNGYTTGGKTLATFAVGSTGAVSYIEWDTDPAWTSSSFTARGALIYNSSKTNKAVCVLDFGSDKTTSNGTFTVVFPVFDEVTALIRLT